MDTARVLRWGLFNFSLVWIAVGFGALQIVGSAFGIEYADVWRAISARTGTIRPAATAIWGMTAAIGTILVLALGVAAGLIRTILRDHGFSLYENGGRLRRARRLFTRSEAVIALPRVQLAAIDTGPVRRRLGWQRLRAQLLGGEGTAERQDIAPLARADEVDRMLAILRLPRGASDEMTPVSSAHVWRAMLRQVALPGLAIAVAGVVWNAMALFALPLLGPILAIALQRRKHHQYALIRNLLQVQRGVLSRTMWIVPIVKIQSVTVSSGWLQRLLGVVTVRIDTAGAGLFAGPDIHDLREDAAFALVAAIKGHGR